MLRNPIRLMNRRTNETHSHRIAQRRSVRDRRFRFAARANVNQKLAGIRVFFRLVMGDPTFDLKVQRKSSGRLPAPLLKAQFHPVPHDETYELQRRNRPH